MTTNAEKSRKVQLERAEKFIARGDQWSDINLHAHLYKKRDAQAVSLSYWSVPNPNPRQTDRVTFEEASVQHYTPTTVGELEFGPSWSTHWFKGKTLILQMLLREVKLAVDSHCNLFFPPSLLHNTTHVSHFLSLKYT